MHFPKKRKLANHLKVVRQMETSNLEFLASKVSRFSCSKVRHLMKTAVTHAVEIATEVRGFLSS